MRQHADLIVTMDNIEKRRQVHQPSIDFHRSWRARFEDAFVIEQADA